MSEKPDGWVAWHHDDTVMNQARTLSASCDWCDTIHPTFESALHELKDNTHEEFDKANCGANPKLNLGREQTPWLKENGWRIRPVKLVFLDEEKA